MARFLAIFFVSAVLFVFLLFVLIISPLPKSIAENWVMKVWPETGFFKMAELKLMPGRPFEADRLEYQIKQDPNLGIIKTESLKLNFDPKEIIFGANATLAVKKLMFDSSLLTAEDVEADLPISFRAEASRLKERRGTLAIRSINSNTMSIRNVKFLFTEKRGRYVGTFRADWIGGVVQGRFDWNPMSGQMAKVEADLVNADLSVLAHETGGAFEQATGICQGSIEAKWEEKNTIKARAILRCPKPGGKIRSAFLRDLADWMPKSPARQLLEEEVAGKDNYYYDSAVFEINNDTPGYWTVHTELNNPRLRLDLPVDISEDSLFVLWNNTELQKILKTWSESK